MALLKLNARLQITHKYTDIANKTCSLHMLIKVTFYLFEILSKAATLHQERIHRSLDLLNKPINIKKKNIIGPLRCIYFVLFTLEQTFIEVYVKMLEKVLKYRINKVVFAQFYKLHVWYVCGWIMV